MGLLGSFLDRCKMAADGSHFQKSFWFYSFLVTVLLVLKVTSDVVHLDNSFNELKKTGFWFVEFYAPWCGHCKHLEPIWEEVGLELMKTSQVVTAKLDCTKFKELAEENGIRGFPTIKFFRRGKPVIYRGPRTKEALVEFAKKASRPILTEFKTTKEFAHRRSLSTVFFLFVNDENTSPEYRAIVEEISENKVAQVVFYSIKKEYLPDDVKVAKVPSILVFKDNSFLEFNDGDSLNHTVLSKWVDREKFAAFTLATDSNVEELADTGKNIVFVVFGTSEQKYVNRKLGEVVKTLATQENHKYGRDYQFAGLMSTGVTDSIMMSSAVRPYILVLEPETRYYYFLPSSELSEFFETNDLASFLDDINNKKATAYGGRSFPQRIKRIWWDISTSAKDIWHKSPLIATMIFVLPLFVVIFLIAMLCCLEPAPDEDEQEETWAKKDEPPSADNDTAELPEDTKTHIKSE